MKQILALTIALGLVTSALALEPVGVQADLPGSEVSMKQITVGGAESNPVAGDLYSISPALGGDDGNFFAVTGRADAQIGTPTVIGTALAAGNPDVTVSDSLIDNGDGTTTLVIDTVSTGELFPAGFTSPILTMGPLDTPVFFVGSPTSLDFSSPAVLADGGPAGIAGAIIGFNDAGGQVFGFNVSSIIGDGTNSGVGTTWDGFLGVGLGATNLNAGVVNVQFLVTYETVPEPSSLLGLLCGLGGLGLLRRR